MNSLTRLLGLAVFLLLLFLAVALGAQAWLHRATRRLQAEAGAAMQVRIAKAVALHPRPVAAWSETDLHDVGELIGGSVHLVQASLPPPPPNDRQLTLDYAVPAAASVLHVFAANANGDGWTIVGVNEVAGPRLVTVTE